MALITLPDNNFDDGVLPIVPQVWALGKCGSSEKNLTVDDVKEIIAETVKETDDKLMVNGVEAGTDNYVRNGQLNDGKLQLNVGEDEKNVEIDLTDLQTDSLSEDEIKKAVQG